MRNYWWILLTLVLAGCTAAAGPQATARPQGVTGPAGTPEPQPTPVSAATQIPDVEVPVVTPSPATGEGAKPRIQVPAVIPGVDLSRHSVPLDQIYLDTFQPGDRAVPLSEASSNLLQELRDAIPPIHNPQYEPATGAGWLDDKDLVIGYATGGEAWAYPIRILNYHEIVNDTLAGEPVLISYCPLCASGIVFSRQLSDQVLTFGNTSALYESDMVMLDYETGSYWWQVAGEAIVGTLTGEHLEILPSVVMPWGEWWELHPETQVLSRNTGRPLQSYDRDPFLGFEEFLNAGRFAFPVSPAAEDPRLLPGTRVLAVKVGDDARAYPLADAGPAAIMDTVGDRPVVLFLAEKGSTAAAFEPEAHGQALSFEVQGGQFVDLETGSVWDLAGRATQGALEGAQLPAIPSRTSYWFAIVAAEPEITLHPLPGG